MIPPEPDAPRTLLHTSSDELDETLTAALAADGTRCLALADAPVEIGESKDVIVVLVDADVAAREPRWQEIIDETAAGRGAAVILIHDGAAIPVGLEIDRVAAFLRKPLNVLQTVRTVRCAFEHLQLERRSGSLYRQLMRRTSEFRRLLEIGMAFASERDIDAQLDLVLSRTREMTLADAGSLFLVVEDGKERRLSFKLAQNDSIDLAFEEKTLPLTTKSLAGYVAVTGNALVFDDVYDLPTDVEYEFNRSVDQETGYRTRSVLVVPMRDYYGRIIGVLQLINRKPHHALRLPDAATVDREVLPFTQQHQELAMSLAGLAAVGLENSLLYGQIERLLESFIRAGAHAIETRDPSTRGHSERVARLTTSLAETVDGVSDGPFQDVRFTRDQLKEIKYAGLLHDFGKIGVREHVLLKPNKLYDNRLEVIKHRMGFVKRSLLSQSYRDELDALLMEGKAQFLLQRAGMSSTIDEVLGELDAFLERILEANRAEVSDIGPEQFERLQADLRRMASVTYEDDAGARRPLLEPDEVAALSIRRGSLDDAERREIQSHVTHTYEFLRRIDWTWDLRNVADIAFAHHEKLDGTGYPRGLTHETIPVQSKMMTVCDIYDALTASDRPYKTAVPTERALDILLDEAGLGKIDRDLVDVFIAKKIFRVTAGGDPPEAP